MNKLRPSQQVENGETESVPDHQNIWITSRCRKEAERRFSRYNVFSHVLLTSYSIALIYFSIRAKNDVGQIAGVDPSDLTILMSASVMVISTLIWGMKFGETAEKHRQCYLEIDRLLALNSDDLGAKYRELLHLYPNHSAFDFESVIFQGWANGSRVYNNSGEITITCLRTISFIVSVVFRLLIAVLLISVPFLIGTLYIWI